MTASTGGPVPAGEQQRPGAHNVEPLGRFTLDAVALFLFSAACGLTHRIHYDEGYARSEGFDGLPVQGPLQGALIAQVFHEMARQSGRRLAALQIRHVSPAYAGQEFRLIQAGSTSTCSTSPSPGSTAPGGDEEFSFRLETGSGSAVAVGTIVLAPGGWPA